MSLWLQRALETEDTATYRVCLRSGKCRDYAANSRQEAFDQAVDVDLIDRERIVSIKRVEEKNAA